MQDKARLVKPPWTSCCTKSSLQESELSDQTYKDVVSMSSPEASMKQRKPGGWKAVTFILGNETFERLATVGLMGNFMVYLTKVFHMDQVSAANTLNIWSGCTNFSPLVGAFISDAYAGRYKTIAFSSFALLLGNITLTLTAWLPQLHPPPCSTLEQIQPNQCVKHNSSQLGILIMGLCFLTVGTAGIRPCSIPFGVDQFDPTTEKGQKGIASFFNWYYATFTLVLLISLTVVVYIQDSVSWVWGFGIPTSLMVCSIILFFAGSKLYLHVKPEGSIFSGIAQVIVACYKKRGLALPENDDNIDGVYYDPPLTSKVILSKLPLTNQFRFLNKGAMILDGEVKPDGTRANKWSLCSIQQVEEVKCLVRIIPIWASGIISFTAMTQQGTFTLSQAMKMDRHLGPKFQIPEGSFAVISMITIAIWLPIYDRILVPILRKVTKHEHGITLLQRIGIGIVFAVFSMIAAGLVEMKRRNYALMHPQAKPLTAMWLSPQLILMGFCEAFNILGSIEFFNQQFPDHMRSLANSLFSVSFACASYTSTLVITIVHNFTGGHGRPDWLTDDINAGRLDYFYFLLAGMGALNLGYFLYVAMKYQYKNNVWIKADPYNDVELNTIKLGEK